MSSPAVVDYASNSTPDPNDRWRVGTLKYTLGGLIWAFVWLLWGDFAFSLMETVFPSILPLRLKELGASDRVMPLIMATIPGVIVFFLNPTISTASDRYRSKMGRRIPFLLFATPFVSGTLILMAFSPELGAWAFRRFAHMGQWSQTGVAVCTVGVIMATFKVFDMFINTVYWYLFNDVVPQAFMNRFMGCFRTVGAFCGMLYNWYVYEHSLTHMRWIFLGAAVIYLVGFGSMCLMLKEGTYPPPDAMAEGSEGFFSRLGTTIATYLRECLSHRIFWYFFLHNMFFGIAGAVGVWDTLLYNSSLDISLARLGKLGAVMGVVSFALNYPIGALADRFHPLRVLFWMQLGLLIIAPLNLLWMFGHWTPDSAFHTLVLFRVIEFPLGMLFWAVQIPMMMRVFPRDRFGQFCSFNAMCSTFVGVIGSLIVGEFMTRMRVMFPDEIWGKDYCYRTAIFWRIPLLAISMVFMWLLIREWRKLGGEKSYTPPGFNQDDFNAHGFEVVLPPAGSEVVLTAADSDVILTPGDTDAKSGV